MKLFNSYRSIKTLRDDELLEKFRSEEDIQYSAELFLRYKTLVYGVCLKYLKNTEEAKDSSMEIFEELHRKLAKHQISNFKSWLYVLVRNHCLMKLRSAQKHVQTEISENDEALIVEFQQELHPIEEREIKFIQMQSAIEDLDEKQAICIKLFYLEEKSYKDISELTGFDIKNIKSYIQNGKRNLKMKMT